MSFDSLLPLIKKTASPLSPAAFHQQVNVIFHDIEARYYDDLHSQMWDSLQEQLNLLAHDVKKHIRSSGLRLLDIGCGTGLSTELLLKSPIGKMIGHVTLADTSSNMLKHASQRAIAWERPFKTYNGDISGLSDNFDVIIVCSVLHHIPDLGNFLKAINSLQSAGGILIHLQDPNGDAMNDTEYLNRSVQYQQERNQHIGLSTKIKNLIPLSFKGKIKRLLGKKDYLDEVNERLLEQKIISRRMSPEEIWSVTDIHVNNLPFSIGLGISLRQMPSWLNNYSLLASRSYGFFGLLKSELPPHYSAVEQKLIDEANMSGRYISAAWIKR
ncbi:MAG TPA: methyltransferase [Flavobacterium sp.]|jgi:2-polyprenyl-3-methyl-5-hydroxy-6-metoxy-1,4-benzoquinol methylase